MAPGKGLAKRCAGALCPGEEAQMASYLRAGGSPWVPANPARGLLLCRMLAAQQRGDTIESPCSTPVLMTNIQVKIKAFSSITSYLEKIKRPFHVFPFRLKMLSLPIPISSL